MCEQIIAYLHHGTLRLHELVSAQSGGSDEGALQPSLP